MQMLEFVDFEHSPKNLLIKAVKRSTSKHVMETAKTKAETLMKEFNFSPTLYESVSYTHLTLPTIRLV